MLNGHGTHCAGIIAVERDGSGVVGVAPVANLYALKVLAADGSRCFSDVIDALNWCVLGPDGKPNSGDEPGIQVTSNSYGTSSNPGTLVGEAFDNAEAAGIVNVCAAGNSGNRRGRGDNVVYH